MKIYIGILLFITSFSTFAQQAKQKLIYSDDNCVVETIVYMKNGEIKKDIKKYKFENEEKCKKMQMIYSENFSPEFVKKVETKYKWEK